MNGYVKSGSRPVEGSESGEVRGIQSEIARRRPCDCPVCSYGRHIQHVKKLGDVTAMRQLIDELTERLWNSEEMLSMYEADAECRAYRLGHLAETYLLPLRQ